MGKSELRRDGLKVQAYHSTRILRGTSCQKAVIHPNPASNPNLNGLTSLRKSTPIKSCAQAGQSVGFMVWRALAASGPKLVV